MEIFDLEEENLTVKNANDTKKIKGSDNQLRRINRALKIPFCQDSSRSISQTRENSIRLPARNVST